MTMTQWETTTEKPKDVRGITDEMKSVARMAMADGLVRKGPATDDNRAAVKAIGRFIRVEDEKKSIRVRENDGVLSWWVTDKIDRPGAGRPKGSKNVAKSNTAQKSNGVTQKSA